MIDLNEKIFERVGIWFSNNEIMTIKDWDKLLLEEINGGKERIKYKGIINQFTTQTKSSVKEKKQ